MVAGIARQQVRVGEAELSVLAQGEGEPVILLHGIPTSATLWSAVLDPLSRWDLRVLAPDLPGYGHTRLPPSADHSLAAAADLVAQWISDSAMQPVWVVGHDAGGAVAQLLATRHRQAVSRLTLTNSIADGSWPALRARVSILGARLGLHRPMAALRLLPNPYMRRQVRRAFVQPPDEDELDAILWDGKVADPRGRASFQRHLAALTPRDTAVTASELPLLDIPCLLVWGMADPFQRWDVAGRRLHALLPSATVVQLDGCGHFTPIECPDRLIAAMLAWREHET